MENGFENWPEVERDPEAERFHPGDQVRHKEGGWEGKVVEVKFEDGSYEIRVQIGEKEDNIAVIENPDELELVSRPE